MILVTEEVNKRCLMFFYTNLQFTDQRLCILVVFKIYIITVYIINGNYFSKQRINIY